MNSIQDQITRKKSWLDRVRLSAATILQAREYETDIGLVYTSNALAGNTLTLAETALVMRERIAIGGKPVTDHMQVLDHADALRYLRAVYDPALSPAPIQEAELLGLHGFVVQRTHPATAGDYRTGPASQSPLQIFERMAEFTAWLRQAGDTPDTAFATHRQLLEISPFAYGNGRTARLLLNLVLNRSGYPMLAIPLEDHDRYREAVRQMQLGQGSADHDRLLYQMLNAALDQTLAAVNDGLVGTKRQSPHAMRSR